MIFTATRGCRDCHEVTWFDSAVVHPRRWALMRFGARRVVGGGAMGGGVVDLVMKLDTACQGPPTVLEAVAFPSIARRRPKCGRAATVMTRKMSPSVGIGGKLLVDLMDIDDCDDDLPHLHGDGKMPWMMFQGDLLGMTLSPSSLWRCIW